MISRGFFLSGVGNIELSTRRQTYLKEVLQNIFLNLVNLNHAKPGSELRERLVWDVETTATNK